MTTQFSNPARVAQMEALSTAVRVGLTPRSRPLASAAHAEALLLPSLRNTCARLEDIQLLGVMGPSLPVLHRPLLPILRQTHQNFDTLFATVREHIICQGLDNRARYVRAEAYGVHANDTTAGRIVPFLLPRSWYL